VLVSWSDDATNHHSNRTLILSQGGGHILLVIRSRQIQDPQLCDEITESVGLKHWGKLLLRPYKGVVRQTDHGDNYKHKKTVAKKAVPINPNRNSCG
jgi:hypothetical protein